MKKLSITSTITLSVGLVMVLVAGILGAVTINGWDSAPFVTTFNSVGYLVAALSGVLLTGCAVISIVKGGDAKKLLISATTIVAVGLAMVVTAAILVSVRANIGGGFTVGTLTTGFAGMLNTIGYLGAVLAGVLLVASGVVSTVKEK